MDLVTVKKFSGKYDLLHPDVEEIQYCFYGIPSDLCIHKNFTVEDEYRTDLEIPSNEQYGVLEFAKDLLFALENKYLYFTTKDSLVKIINYLETNKEEQERLWNIKIYDDLTKKRDVLLKDLDKLEKHIEKLKDLIE